MTLYAVLTLACNIALVVISLIALVVSIVVAITKQQ